MILYYLFFNLIWFRLYNMLCVFCFFLIWWLTASSAYSPVTIRFDVSNVHSHVFFSSGSLIYVLLWVLFSTSGVYLVIWGVVGAGINVNTLLNMSVHTYVVHHLSLGLYIVLIRHSVGFGSVDSGSILYKDVI